MKQWTALKNIISGIHVKQDLFLSLIDRDGKILCINAAMQKALHLKDPRQVSQNFYQILLPEHISTFKEILEKTYRDGLPGYADICLRNGYYHPMKWQVNALPKKTGSIEQFLCIGYAIDPGERLEQFNELGEKNYQVIVDGLNAGILFQDKNGNLISANQKSAEIFGTSLEQLYRIGNVEKAWSLWDIKNEEGQLVAFSETPFMKALHSGISHSDVLVINRRNQSAQYLLFNSTPLLNDQEKEPYSIVTNIVDVTREYQLHNEICDRDLLFHSFMTNTPTLAWVIDESATLLFASASFYEYFRLDEKSSVNQDIFSLVPASTADALYSKHLQVLEKGNVIETVEKVKWSDGTNFVFHINMFPIQGSGGKKMMGGHAVNMADKYAVEKQLREANERLLMISRATSDAIWEWDMQTGYIFRNDALMDLIGYQGDDTKGLSWWLRRIHPDDRNRVTDKIKDATDKGQHSWEDEYRFKCSDGSFKHIHDRGYVVYENGLPVKMIGSLQDITELKDLEHQLVEEKLKRQKEISETVIRVQEKERTRIGHELHDNVNQILSTTKMFIEMLNPGNEEEKKLKQKSIEYILTSIEEIRKLSKELVVPHLKEKGIIESIYSLIEDIHLSAKIKIRFVHDQEADLLSPGKKITIFRIVQEQLKNILKYSKATDVDICLQCKDNQVNLVIRDNGIGFDPKQAHTGIGFSNIHDRTRFYNGKVEILSSKGKGCTVSVSIPQEG